MESSITNNEREFLLQLLQKEENNLQIELRHTSHREFKQILKDRLQTITDLIEKFKVAESKVVF